MASAAVAGNYRRGKTALFLIACGWAGAAPHWLEAGRSLFPAITLAFFLGGDGLRVVLKDRRDNYQLKNEDINADKEFLKKLPKIDVLVDGGKINSIGESTIIDFVDGDLKIVREGSISKMEIENVL